jgi:hypothetical protein
MVSRRLVVLGILLAVTAAACSGTASGAKVPQSGGGLAPSLADEGGTTLVRLLYTRPASLGRTGRPSGFGVIANYESSDVIHEYDGTWDDETMTLSDQISFVIGSRNLVYVVDAAVPPGLPTEISAGREGRLRRIPCTPAVTTVQVCYVLEVVRGHQP